MRAVACRGTRGNGMGKRMRIFITGLPVISLGGWVSFSEGGRTAPGTYLITMDARGAYRGQCELLTETIRRANCSQPRASCCSANN